ncbi:hypothetical protein [Aliikangiella sp. G2MR2-5]|uniref:hypothetical protein n=1 Tax=Aliikangiella sp. G2MR2-5 TaxID=2788943 RepID=UPI0018AB1310|nr:hypothetical protein [Aliikangiella sp. G2MR2-5]
MRNLFLIIFISLLSGCSSIPFSSWSQFSSFDGQQFRRIKPGDIRVKVEINQNVEMNINKTRLDLGLVNASSNRQVQLYSKLVEQQLIDAQKGFFSDTPAMRSTTYRLAEESVEQFRQLQSAWALKGDNQLTFSVAASIPDAAKESSESVYLTTSIKLSKNADYITLIERYSVN